MTLVGSGFTGFGALGGGNLTILAGGDAGAVDKFSAGATTTASFNAAIGGSGYVRTAQIDGKTVLTPVQTGGGDLTIAVRGDLNPTAAFRNATGDVPSFGTITDLRGTVTVDAGGVGSVGLGSGKADSIDTRATNPFAPYLFARRFDDPLGSGRGPNVYLGDAALTVTSRGDINLSVSGNPGTVFEIKPGGSTSLFSMWTDRTALNLTSLGGNLNTVLGNATRADDFGANGSAFFVPSTINEIAETGSLSVGGSFELAPSAKGQLKLIAGNSIFSGGYSIGLSGADPALLSTIFRPLYNTPGSESSIVAFGPDSPTFNLHANDPVPVQIAAVNGDILNLKLNDQAKFAEISAGRDIFGVNVFILNNNLTDMSSIRAGRDIFYANAKIAGPGLLEVQAGRNLYQGARGQLESVGLLFSVDQNNRSGGAGITAIAGAGSTGPDYTDFITRYLDPANLANPALPLTGQGGKVSQNYIYDGGDGKGLITWLRTRYGFSGSAMQAYAFYRTLSLEQQAIFARQVYFAELKAGGREYNNPASPRFRSYYRSREAVSSLFPSKDATGKPIVYEGDITEFYSQTDKTGSFIRTDFGGDIQTLTPGGQTLIGVEGAPPGADAGFLTQGAGNIDIFARDSILLGQSRVFTTFGGDILAYSETGDINAGRGSKTAQIFSPPRRITNNYGIVTISPNVPTTGAGFATLNPIPEIPPGDIDLVAPLGTVDAGEAGIRVSGNINVAALKVLNANNITVQGKSSGLPVFEGPNTGALTNAANTSAAATNVPPPPKTEARPSIIIVEIVGFGGADEAPGKTIGNDCPDGTRKVEGKCPLKPLTPPAQAAVEGQDPDSAVLILGEGRLSPAALQSLKPEQRKFLIQ